MFGWFKIKSPVTVEQRAWIEQRFDWLRSEFGDERLWSPVITPTDEFFPDPYAGVCDDAEILFERVCQYMAVNRERVELQFYSSRAADAVSSAFDPTLQRSYALGAFQQTDEGIDIWLETSRHLVLRSRRNQATPKPGCIVPAQTRPWPAISRRSERGPLRHASLQ